MFRSTPPPRSQEDTTMVGGVSSKAKAMYPPEELWVEGSRHNITRHDLETHRHPDHALCIGPGAPLPLVPPNLRVWPVIADTDLVGYRKRVLERSRPMPLTAVFTRELPAPPQIPRGLFARSWGRELGKEAKFELVERRNIRELQNAHLNSSAADASGVVETMSPFVWQKLRDNDFFSGKPKARGLKKLAKIALTPDILRKLQASQSRKKHARARFSTY